MGIPATLPLGEIAEVTSGGSAPQDPRDFGGDIPFVRVSHLSETDFAVSGCDFVTPDAAARHRLRRFPAGTIVFPKSGASIRLEKRAILPFESCLVSHLAAVLPDESIVDRDYLFYYLVSQRLAEDNPDGYPTLRLGDLSRLPIALPTLDEQRRIAGILSTIRHACGTRQRCSKAVGIVVKALVATFFPRSIEQAPPTLLGMPVEWLETTLGGQIALQRGFDITKKEQVPGPVPVVSSSGITSFHNTAMARAPGVVIGRKGSLGTAHYLDREYWPHDTTLWVTDFKGNNPRFVYYFLRQLDVGHLNVGASNPTLNRNHLYPTSVVWPDLASQQRIAGTMDVLHGMIAAEDASLHALENVFEAVVNRLVGGAIS